MPWCATPGALSYVIVGSLTNSIWSSAGRQRKQVEERFNGTLLERRRTSRGEHLLEHGRIELGFRKVLAFLFVHSTGIADIARRVHHLLAGTFPVACCASGQTCFEFEQAALD